MTNSTWQNTGIKLFAIFILAFILLSFTICAGDNNQITLYINEFMASNGDTILDEKGNSGDWIEIYNPTDESINIGGFYISDHKNEPLRWQIPGGYPDKTTIPPGGYLLLWADEEPDRGPLHLNFKLDKDGESIILTAPDKKTVIDQIEFTKQKRDVSYGRMPDGSDNWKFFLKPTPTAPNETKGFSSLKTAGFYSFYLDNKPLVNLLFIFLLVLILLSIVLFKLTTKYRQNKEQLRKINVEQALLLNNIQTQVWYLDGIDKYGTANKAHLEFLGIDNDELKNKSLLEIYSEEEAAACIEDNIEVFNKKEQIKTERWVSNAQGEKRLLSITKTPKLDDNGQVEYVICSAEDITEKKRIEEQIRSLVREYETIISNTQDAIFLVDIDENGQFRYNRVNFAYIQETGLSFAEIKGKTPQEVYGEEIGRKIESNYMRCLREKNNLSYEEELELSAGKRIYHTNLSPIIINDKVIQIVGSSRDITERKQMEEEIKLNEREYRSLFEDSPIGLIKVDNKCNVIDVNQEMLLLIVPPGKEKTLEFNLLEMPSLQRAGLSQKLSLAINEKRPISGEGFYTSTWGKKIWLNYNIKPILDEKGKVTEVIIACQDISDKKEAEERIKYLTFHDSLTGLYNRAYFKEELRRYDTPGQLPLSIIFTDINGLKLTNDAFGHQKGDELLIKVAQTIKSTFRQEDLVARWGGDEFVILLPQTNEKEVREMCFRLKESFKEFKAEPIKPNIALGYATKTKSSENIHNIFKKAENLMYKNKLSESKKFHTAVISSLKKTLNEINHETFEHSNRIKELALQLGEALNLSGYQLKDLGLLAELHDLGKVSIPKKILEKKEQLTPEEWEEIKRHPEIGYKIACSSPELSNIAEGILSHHEWWDGSGYPQGLKGKEIPLISRIITIVDAYDIMTNGSPYKAAMSKKEALKELEKGAGSQFDPEIVDVFIKQVLAESTSRGEKPRSG